MLIGLRSKTDRRSIASCCTIVGGNLYFLEKLETTSYWKISVEAEYWVTAHGCCELSWLRIFLEVGFKQDGPTSLHCNSISAIKIAKNPYHEKTKYVGADCHFIKEKNREKM